MYAEKMNRRKTMNDLRSTRRSVLRAGLGALLALPLFRASPARLATEAIDNAA